MGRSTCICPDEFLVLANRCADAARDIIGRHFRRLTTTETKADMTPVTEADREAEAAMRTLIEAAFPDHGIIGEEFGSVRSDADHLWILDPIDGTKAFIAGLPVFGTLIALWKDGKPLLGVIDQPVIGERWVGAAGRPTTLNGERANAANCDVLSEAVLAATSPEMFKTSEAASFSRLSAATRFCRYGGDCYSYGLLSSGHIHLVVEAGLKPYDYAALTSVVTGANGIVTDWYGNPISLDSDGRIIAACSARLHAQAITIRTQ